MPVAIVLILIFTLNFQISNKFYTFYLISVDRQVKDKMQQNQSSVQHGKANSIYPYYKPDNIFERDQAYYQQLQKNTRRVQNSGASNTQFSQRVPYQAVETQYNNYQQNYVNPQNEFGYQSGGNKFQSTVQNVPFDSQDPSQYQAHDMGYADQSFGQHNSSQSPTFSRTNNPGQSANIEAYNPGMNSNNPQKLAYNLGVLGVNNPQMSHSPVNQQNYRNQTAQNKALKRRLDDLINFRDQFDDGSQLQKKHHYNKDSNQGRKISNQQQQIQSLLQQVKRNNIDVGRYRCAIIQLQKSINNIQSVDRQIYRQLTNLSNRDQQLLNQATTALARGAARQEVAAVLQRIIS